MRHRLLFSITAALIAMPVVAQAAHADVASQGPSAGFFVVGDLSASPGATVQFWGAQWSRNNILSGGLAPAAFKGFADTVGNPSCPVRWSTDPGNSASPPSTLSPTITVIVSSSITKSGASVSGNVLELVTVQTEPGYEGDPGHGGYGTVMSVVSCGTNT